MSDRTYTNRDTGEVVEATPRLFTEVLAELGEGSTLTELSEAFYDVVQRVQDTAKSGSVTLTLNVGFDGQGRLVVKDEVKHKLPEFSRPETRFFVDKQGNASRRNPAQPTIPGVTDITSKKEAN